PPRGGGRPGARRGGPGARGLGPPSPAGEARQAAPGRRPGRARPQPAEAGEGVGGRAVAPGVPGDPREGDPGRLAAVQDDEPARRGGGGPGGGSGGGAPRGEGVAW